MSRSIKAIILLIILLVSLCGCCEEHTKTEYEIVHARYTSVVSGVFSKHLEETLEITYIDQNGEYITKIVDTTYQLCFGKENRVIYTDEGSFFGYFECMLTQDSYNKIVSSSPMIVNVQADSV